MQLAHYCLSSLCLLGPSHSLTALHVLIRLVGWVLTVSCL